jgi:hypothetical protein
MTYDMKTTLQDDPGRTAVSEPRPRRRLIAQWHKDARNRLVTCWVIEADSNVAPLPETLAA